MRIIFGLFALGMVFACDQTPNGCIDCGSGKHAEASDYIRCDVYPDPIGTICVQYYDCVPDELEQ